MITNPRAVTHFSALICFALAAIAHAQARSPVVQLESTQRFAFAQPATESTGSCWAWRGANELRLSSSASTIPGNFLAHQWSANGATLLALELPNDAREASDKSTVHLRWFDAHGQLLGSYALRRHEDDPLPRVISNRLGTHTLMLEPASGRVTFLTEAARFLRTSVLFENAPYTNERPAFLAASDEYFYILSQFAPTTARQPQAPVLLCYALNGEEQWRHVLPLGTAGYLALSPSGKLLVLNQYEVTGAQVHAMSFLLDAKAQVRAKFSGLVREATFASDEQFVFVLDRRELRAVETATGKIVWQYHLHAREELFITAKAISHPAAVVALVGANEFEQKRFVYKNARIIIFNQAGQVQSEVPITETLVKPQLVVAAPSQKLLLAAEGLLQQYQIDFNARAH